MLAERAYLELYPEARLGEYSFSLEYSGKFSGYNANIRKKPGKIHFSLSRKWERIDEDIKIGIMQTLLNRLMKTKVTTRSIELYEIFLKKVHIAIPKVKTDAILEESYNYVNELYLNGIIEKPNLQWGSRSMRTLGRYDYGTDTITISTIFRNAEKTLLNYVMYHEVLHKKHKFLTKGARNFHHTKDFLKDEARFGDIEKINKDISRLVRRAGFNDLF
ncbi:hypothetical protein J4401_05750 [Candidatus Woesearchaeota archaeon]|nr:hypothetical protein [Candidatus Woesearchaeota archaeon]